MTTDNTDREEPEPCDYRKAGCAASGKIVGTRWICNNHLASRAAVAAEKGDALRPEHQCRPLARAVMMEGRDWWIGELLETVPEWPHETHCLHMKTPLKDVSFLCNAGDFEQLLVLSNVVVNLENLPWLRASTAGAKVRLQAPFSSTCVECGGSGKTTIGCAVDSPLAAPCAACGGTGRKLRTVADYEDKGIPDKEPFDRLLTEYHQMPRRHCAVHNREEFKYESLEHELHEVASSPVAPSLIPEQDAPECHAKTCDRWVQCGDHEHYEPIVNCTCATTPATATAAEQERCHVSVTGRHRIDPPFCKDCGQTFATGTVAATSGAREAHICINADDPRQVGLAFETAAQAKQFVEHFPPAVPVDEQKVPEWSVEHPDREREYWANLGKED